MKWQLESSRLPSGDLLHVLEPISAVTMNMDLALTDGCQAMECSLWKGGREKRKKEKTPQHTPFTVPQMSLHRPRGSPVGRAFNGERLRRERPQICISRMPAAFPISLSFLNCGRRLTDK